MVRRRTGLDPLTPRWRATLAAFYGLPLSETDVTELAASTRRTTGGIRALSGGPLTPRDVEALAASPSCGKEEIRQLSIRAGMNRAAFRELWARVGRRGRKSCSAAFLGVYEAAFGGHEAHLIPGERGLIAVISKDIAGSTAVARFAELHAQALGIACRWTSMGNVKILELDGLAFGIACFPCSATAPRGYAIPVVIADEIAHWQTDADEYANADTAVLGAVKPAMAQFPNAKLICISSPLGCAGVFHETVERCLGDDADPGVLAVEGPTWLWNPEISEERTHELERDADTHAREFGAIPSSVEGLAFDQRDVARCYVRRDEIWQFGRPVIALDPASGGGNTFALLVARWCLPSRERGCQRDSEGVVVRDEWDRVVPAPLPTSEMLWISSVTGWTAEQFRQLGVDRVVAEIASIAHAHDASMVVSDKHADVWLAAMLEKHQIYLNSFRQTAESKHEAATLLRALMRDGQLHITEHERMRRDLQTYPRRVVGGGFRYGAARAGHHWDYASALMLLAHSVLAGRDPARDEHVHIEGNPVGPQLGRFVVSRHT